MKKVKRFLMVIGMLGCIGSMQAQQIQGDFNAAWGECNPYTGGGTKTTGKQPVGWTISHIAGYNLFGNTWFGATTVASSDVGRDGTGYAVNMVNSPNSVAKTQMVPAYLTLGTSWNTANTSGSEADGGTFGGISFTNRPDAIHFYYKRSVADDTQPASAIAYLWSGTFKQASVPVNVANKPTNLTMVDRDRNILGMTTDKGGEVTNENGKLIASLEYYISETNPDEWKELTVNFDYKDLSTVPQKLNVIFSANNYFAAKSDVKKDNRLIIDDVTLVYNSQLSTLTYDGITIPNFAIDNYNTLDMSAMEYDASKLAYTSNGVGATVETIFDNATGLLTVTVKGDDISVNAENKHVYKVQFKKMPTLTSVSISGENFAAFNPEIKEYTLPYAYSPGIVITGVAGDGFTVQEALYKNVAKTITLNVTDGTTIVSYVFNFSTEVANVISGKYAGALSVVLTTTDQSTGGTIDQPTPLANAPMYMTYNENGTVNLILNDFSFAGILVGDIYVSNIPVSNNVVERTVRTIRITAYKDGIPNNDAFGWMLGNLPVAVSATILDTNKKYIEASIDIITTETALAGVFANIHVDFEPYEIAEAPIVDDFTGISYASMTLSGQVTQKGASILHAGLSTPMTFVDMTNATVDANVVLSNVLNAAPEKNNTLVYVPATSTITGTNVIVGNKATNIVLTDKVAFNAPKAFAADVITYTRNCYTDGGWETIALPFAVSNVSGEYQLEKFKSSDDTKVSFETATTWEANTAYLFSLKGDGTTVDCTFIGSGAIEPTTWAGKFLGTYDKMDAVGKYLMGQDGKSFVLGVTEGSNSAYVEPFRAYLDETAVPGKAPSYTIEHDGGATGMGMDKVVNTIYVSGSTIIVNSAEAMNINVYDIVGKLVRTVSLNEGENSINGLPAGFYVVNGQKVVIK